jgi:hypothetical protein
MSHQCCYFPLNRDPDEHRCTNPSAKKKTLSGTTYYFCSMHAPRAKSWFERLVERDAVEAVQEEDIPDHVQEHFYQKLQQKHLEYQNVLRGNLYSYLLPLNNDSTMDDSEVRQEGEL